MPDPFLIDLAVVAGVVLLLGALIAWAEWPRDWHDAPTGKDRRPGFVHPTGHDAICTPHAHHVDYTKRLEVEWLCPSCHRAAHRRQKKTTGPHARPDRRDHPEVEVPNGTQHPTA